MELNKKEIYYACAALHVYIKKKSLQVDSITRRMLIDTENEEGNKIRGGMIQRRVRDIAVAEALLERLKALAAEIN